MKLSKDERRRLAQEISDELRKRTGIHGLCGFVSTSGKHILISYVESHGRFVLETNDGELSPSDIKEGEAMMSHDLHLNVGRRMGMATFRYANSPAVFRSDVSFQAQERLCP